MDLSQIRNLLFGLQIFSWQDGIEILFFALSFYYISLWLKQDRHSPLLGYFYLYCIACLTANFAHLETAKYLLFSSWPIVFSLLILFHQKILQKNFVSFKQIKPAYKDDLSWIHLIIKNSIEEINNGQEFYGIIEGESLLTPHLNTDFSINAPCSKQLLQVLVKSQHYQPTTMVWLDKEGMLRGINTRFSYQPDPDWIIHHHHMNEWEISALFLSTKTDAFFLTITPKNRLFSCIVQCKQLVNLQPEEAERCIQSWITKKNYGIKKEERYRHEKKPPTIHPLE